MTLCWPSWSCSRSMTGGAARAVCQGFRVLSEAPRQGGVSGDGVHKVPFQTKMGQALYLPWHLGPQDQTSAGMVLDAKACTGSTLAGAVSYRPEACCACGSKQLLTCSICFIPAVGCVLLSCWSACPATVLCGQSCRQLCMLLQAAAHLPICCLPAADCLWLSYAGMPA